MSDETTRTDDWAAADASGVAAEGAPAGQIAGEAASRKTGAPENAARPSAFCQDCGCGLTPETQRTVGAGAFCEPCLETRLRQGSGVYGAGPGRGAPQGPPQPAMYGTPPVAALPGEPSPVLAGVLGLIPGVGAMYNGQFAKGVMHLIVFVILVFMTNNVSGVFGLFVAGWIFYQAFEAYHTAVARRDGLPLPNPFGFNDIGERMGFGRSWGGVGSVKTGQAPPTIPWAEDAAPVAPAGSAPPATPGSNWARYAPPTAGPDWVGYVPPTAFAGVPPANPVPSAQAVGQAQQTGPSWNRAPYVETYTGSGGAPTPPGYSAPPFTPAGQVAPALPARRFPMGALWLIGLGLLILLANLLPDWRISSRWWPPVLFAGLSLWLFTRRLQAGAGSSGAGSSGARIACIVRWPAILVVLAILFALHAAYFVVTFGMMCAVLLITLGALLLLERTLGGGPGYGAPAPPYSEPAYGGAGPGCAATDAQYSSAREPPAGTFAAPEPGVTEPADPNDVAKGGL